MNRDLAFICAALLTWGIGEGMFYAFQPLYLQELGADPVGIGAILGTVGLAMTVVHLPAGYLADTFSRRALMYASWIMGTLATVLMAFAPNLAVFVSGSILYGLTAFVMVPLNSYITAARGSWSVARALTTISIAFNLGAIAGPVIGGWIGENFGLQRAYGVAAAFFVVSTLLLLPIRRQPREEGVDARNWRLGGILNRRVILFLGILMLALFATYLPQPLTPNFLQNQREINLAQMGTLISSLSLGVVAINLLAGRINARPGFVITQAGVGLFSALIWLGSGFAWYLAGYFLMGAYRTGRSLAIAQSRALVQPSQMGMMYGMVETSAGLSIILAPPLAGWLYTINPELVYQISLVLIAISIFVTIFFMPLRREDIL